MRALARMFRNESAAEYGLEHALPTTGVGRRVVVAGGKSPRRVLLHVLKQAIGTNLVVYHAMHLQGVVRGEQRNLGECAEGKRKLHFDLWLPHLGIAVDMRLERESDEDIKREWCRERAVFYFAPADCEDDYCALREAIDKRREVVHGSGH